MRRILNLTFSVSALLVAALFAVSICAAQDSERARPLNELEIKRATNKELIDQLAHVSAFGAGFNSATSLDEFIAVDGKPDIEDGNSDLRSMLRVFWPSSGEAPVHPALKELVSRGANALPDLIAHVSDARKTKLSIRKRPHSDYFHSRYHMHAYDTTRAPRGMNTGKLEDKGEIDTIRIGDVCYVAVGQIVNRNLNVIRFCGKFCQCITSPIHTPILAELVKEEWGGLTAEAHRMSLIADAHSPGSDDASSALKRLAFYYPESAETTVLELLDRELYDDAVVRRFVEDELIKQTTVEDWHNSIERFRDKHGHNVAASIPFWLHKAIRFADNLTKQKVAREILEKVFPVYDPVYTHDDLPLFHAARFYEQVEIVRAVRLLKSPRVDDAVHQLFLTPWGAHVSSRDKLALLCAERLGTADKRHTYRRYFSKRIRQLKRDLTDFELGLYVPSMENRLWGPMQIEETIPKYTGIVESIRE